MNKVLVLLAYLLTFSSCSMPPNLANLKLIGAGSAGELVSGEIDKDKLVLQLAGKGKTPVFFGGRLRAMAKFKNFYTIKEEPSLNLGISPNNLIIYSSNNRLGKFGVVVYSQQKPYKVSAIAGYYNFVSKYRHNNTIKLSFGSFELRADHTWRVWKFRDGVSDKSNPRHTGSWVDTGTGVIMASLEDKTPFGKLLLSEANGGEFIIIDLLHRTGMALGMKRKPITPDIAESDYYVLSSNKNKIRSARVYDGFATHGKRSVPISYNEPWEGFIKDSRGEFLGIFSPQGIFFGINIGAISGSQYIFAAVKKS